MAETDELLMRLKQLEDGYYGDKEAARQEKFFNTYGPRFSNNRGLGMAILNELDARGVDTSAADEAVQQILDTLRTECNEIIESIKDVQEAAINNAKKIETISEAVQDSVVSNPDAEEPVAEEPVAEEPVANQTGKEMLNEVSDIRMKRIRAMNAHWGKKSDSTIVSDERMKNVYKPSAGILSAAQRGF